MKKVNKKRISIALAVFLMLFSIGSVYALSYSETTLYMGKSSAETESAGLSKSADFKVTTYSSSKAPTNASVHACWSGWPYSLEQNRVVPIGQTWEGREPQDKDSNFFVKLWGMNYNKTYAYGHIEAN